ncbi:MAG TPA: Ig-like domain-containing protein [Planctomycetota bacterium]
MRKARSSLVISGLLALVVAGCSGSGGDSTSSLQIRCANGQAFCIISCDLGCSQTGCSVSEIAENQRLRFAFSDAVDPASVNNASISIRTVTGVPPDGEYLVSGREVTFVPSVRTVGGVTTFGFARNESYIITLAGGNTAAQGVRSTAGDTLSAEFSCTVLASRGILDEDQLPPSAELISPTNVLEAPVNPTIVLRFSELIDTTPLQGPLTVSSPMRVILRQRTLIGACDYDSDGVSLEGVPQVSTELVGQTGSQRPVSVVTFQSPVQLPGNSCIVVSVTADLRDISGRAAVPANFEILTVPGISVPITINELFLNNNGFDPLVSGGQWNNGARPGQLGGDGRHGRFDHTHGTPNSAGEFEFNNDNFVVTPARSLTGLPYLITDGKYYFTDFVIPEGVKVRFVSPVNNVPAQIFVRGQADIRGTIDVSGAEMPFWIPAIAPAAGQKVSNFDSRGVNIYQVGQPGGQAGCGGGRGGDGGAECRSTGPDIVPGFPPPYDGKPGVDVRVPAAHAYGGQVPGTGGQPGVLNPASGLTINSPVIGGLYRPHFSVGGSGGGYSGPGTQPTGVPLLGVVFSPAGAPGSAFPVSLYPPPVPPPDYTALDHFLIGGSGGGGGGSAPFGTQGLAAVATTPPNVYQSGHGGTGGGGAVAIRTGGTIVVGQTGVLRSKGGAGVLINGDSNVTPASADLNSGVSSPGGGGSGGSFLLQSSVSVTINGALDTGGGTGSRTGFITPTAVNQVTQAGNGSNGFYQLQSPGPLVSFAGTATPTFNPAIHSGPLTDRDTGSGCTSTWRTSTLIFPPTWLRYELDVDQDGDGVIDTTYTDSGLPGTFKANDPNGPVVILFQGTRLNQAGTEPLPGEPIRPWRDGVGSGPLQGQGINVDSSTGFRFMMTYNTGLFPNLVVRALRVFAQT